MKATHSALPHPSMAFRIWGAIGPGFRADLGGAGPVLEGLASTAVV